jgi:hypothetical protein
MYFAVLYQRGPGYEKAKYIENKFSLDFSSLICYILSKGWGVIKFCYL